MLIRVTMIGILGLGIAFTGPAEATSKSPGATLKLLDTDKDGKISKTEAAKGLLPEAFAKIDADSDGFLTVTPFRFRIKDVNEHFHLPLKFTRWGFALFRGA